MELNYIPTESTEPVLGDVKEDLDFKNSLQAEVPYHLFQYIPFDSNASKLQNVCRICLSIIQETKFSLLSLHDSEMLVDMLKSFTSIIVYLEDKLPSFVCEACHDDVINCYAFKTKCEKSDFILQSLLKSEILIEESADIKREGKHDNDPETTVGTETVKEDIDWTLDLCKEEYLEDLPSSDNEALCIVQNTDKKINDSRIAITDPESILKGGIPDKKALKKQHICTFCLKKFDKIKNLRLHITKRHSTGNNAHPCDLCKEVFTSEHDLHVHSAVHSAGPTWKCNKCSKEFTAKACLRRHVQRHMERKRHACERCGKAFSERYALRRHARVHTGEAREKRHACHLCDKKYADLVHLKTHLLQHAGQRLFPCASCDKAFASPRLLASHRRLHSEHKAYPCAYCDKRFRHESTRNTHHRTHTGEKPYVCAVCGKTFIQNSNLTLHMRTHTGEKPYSCDKCGQKFSTGSSLKTHKMRHTGEKPYGCEVCGKKFARRDLRLHMRQHTGERPHACALCARAFVSAARLRDHARIHTGEKPYECSTCTKSFATKSQLIKHFKKHQPKKKREYRGPALKRAAPSRPTPDVADEQITNNKKDVIYEQPLDEKFTLEITPEQPLEVSGELVVQDECEVKEILVMDNSQNEEVCQSENICLNASDVNFVNSNLVTVNEGTTVKLYQLDQSLLQIHSSGGQVTISKITSKMTANF